MLTFRRLDVNTCDWERIDAVPDRVVYQTREWVGFIAKAQGADPVIADVFDGQERLVARFTGLIVKRFGLRILGSPFPGWNTGPLGFNLLEPVDRRLLAESLVCYAFGPLRCVHLEILDPVFAGCDLAALGFRSTPQRTYRVALARDEEAIFADMSSACRRAIRKASKSGVTVEQASGVEFADEYYAQLEDVFAKQSLQPGHGVDRVRQLIEAMEPTGRLLLLRSVSPHGERIATGIFLGMNQLAFYWGGASWRVHQQLRPNELLMWHAIRYWRGRGLAYLDLGGGTEEGFADYKRKFGTEEVIVPALRRSRFRLVGAARDAAATLTTSPLVQSRGRARGRAPGISARAEAPQRA